MSFLSRWFKRGKKDHESAPEPTDEHRAPPPTAPARRRPPQPAAKAEPKPAPRPGPPRAEPRPEPAPPDGRPPARKPEPAPSPPPAATRETMGAPIAVPFTQEPEVRRLGLAMDEQRAQAILESVLDDLGTAHHRPFSRG